MEVLLSIKPKSSEKIFSGEKKVEFRRKLPKEHIDRVFVYETTPSQKIVGWFSIETIHSGTPEEIWEKCKETSGTTKKKFDTYCKDVDIIYALEIKETVKLKYEKDPFKLFSGFKPPQSFAYVDGSLILKDSKNK